MFIYSSVLICSLIRQWRSSIGWYNINFNNYEIHYPTNEWTKYIVKITLLFWNLNHIGEQNLFKLSLTIKTNNQTTPTPFKIFFELN